MPRISVSLMCAAGLCVGLAGCAGNGVATGSGYGDDLAMDTLMGVVMLGSPKEKDPEINYTPRPGLVMPGTATALPEPRQAASANANWPNDPEENRVNILAPEREKVSLRSALMTRRDPVLTDRERDRQLSERMRQERRDGRDAVITPRSSDLAEADGTPKRRYLTDPPVEIRQPAVSSETGEPVATAVVAPAPKKPFLRRILPF